MTSQNTQTTHPAYSITAPGVMTMKPDASGQFTIVNTGTKPITVHESLGRYSKTALQYPAADHATAHHTGQAWITIDGPASFTLAPHTARSVHVTSHVPAGAQGTHAIDILWTATPVKAVSGPLHLSGAVASTVMLPMPGVAVPAGPDRLPAGHLAPHHGGIGTTDIAGIGLAAVLIASVAGVALKRRRTRRNRAQEVQA